VKHDDVIDSFSGEHEFLSNFYASKVKLEGVVYPPVEHAFQAAKTIDAAERAKVAKCRSPAAAKAAGRKVKMRRDWDTARLGVMKGLLAQKFEDPHLRELLLATGDRELVEGNSWRDTFWGVYDGRGENHLGRLLMQVRAGLRRVR
jgi:ribA/ribD-fused uncharacterized protein